MSSCFLGVPHSLHSVHVPGHSAHFFSCQEFQPRRQYEGKFAICAILETVCPAHKYSDWHSVWKQVYPGCRGKKKHAQKKNNLKHAWSCISSLDKYIQLGNSKEKEKDIKNNLSTSHSMQGRFIQMQLEGKHYFFPINSFC